VRGNDVQNGDETLLGNLSTPRKRLNVEFTVTSGETHELGLGNQRGLRQMSLLFGCHGTAIIEELETSLAGPLGKPGSAGNV
jgi:hypothetical protein